MRSNEPAPGASGSALPPLVYVVLINWRGWPDTIDCLDSLLALTYPRFGVVVVDNASGDESIPRLEAWARERVVPLRSYAQTSTSAAPTLVEAQEPRGEGLQVLDLIAASTNTGFCAGNNTGLAHGVASGAEYLFVLNNDTVCEPGCLEPLVSAAQADPSLALLSPLICYADDRETIWWGGGEFGALLAPRYRRQGSPRSALGSASPQDSDWASGCATLMSAETFERFGGFDERFFIWCEEWDLSLRVRAAGLKIKVVPRAVIHHKVGRSLGVVSPLTFYYGMRNMLMLRRRHLPRLKWLAAAAATFPWKLLQAARLSLARGDRSYMQAYLDVLREGIEPVGGIWKRQSR